MFVPKVSAEQRPGSSVSYLQLVLEKGLKNSDNQHYCMNVGTVRFRLKRVAFT